MALHGNGGSAADMGVLTGLSKASDTHGFVVAYPQGEARAWGIEIAGSHFGRDRTLLDSTVGALGTGGCIDPSRVILVGFSLGGIIGDELACTDTERFHVIVEVSSRDVSEPCAPSGPVTFVAYSGMLDDILPYKGGRLFGWTFPPAEAWAAGWAAHNGCSVGPLTTESNDRLDRLDWSGCGAPTVFYRIKRGPHTWFGGDPPIGGIGLEDTDPVETVLRLVQGQAP
jgi:polyhydroxybutyrate depolymerase